MSENPFLQRAHETLYQGKRFWRIFLGRGVTNRDRILEENRIIIDAVAEGLIQDAAVALKAHIDHSTTRDRCEIRED